MNKYKTVKKQAERKQLDLLLRCCPEIPRGRIIPMESPDFIIQHGPKNKTGIEFTRFTRDARGTFKGKNRFIPHLAKDALLHLIRSKEEKLPLYRKHQLNKIWLVIVVEGFQDSPAFNIHNQLSNWQIDSTFDTILIMNLALDNVYIIEGHLHL